jgi:hypothetical protein
MKHLSYAFKILLNQIVAFVLMYVAAMFAMGIFDSVDPLIDVTFRKLF